MIELALGAFLLSVAGYLYTIWKDSRDRKQNEAERKEKEKERAHLYYLEHLKQEKPYIEAFVKIYSDVSPSLSKISSAICIGYNNITGLLDNYADSRTLEGKAPRLFLSDSIFDLIEKMENEMLFQHIEYLKEQYVYRYRRLIYDYDFKNEEKVAANKVVYEISKLYQHISEDNRMRYYSCFMLKYQKVVDIFIEEKDTINEAKKLIKYQLEVFKKSVNGNSVNELSRLLGGLNLLLEYIQNIQVPTNIDRVHESHKISVSYIFADLLMLQIVNESLIKLMSLSEEYGVKR